MQWHQNRFRIIYFHETNDSQIGKRPNSYLSGLGITLLILKKWKAALSSK